MPTLQVLIDQWVDDVYNHSEIDPENNYCWESMAIGYYLGKGHSIKQAEFLVRKLKMDGKI